MNRHIQVSCQSNEQPAKYASFEILTAEISKVLSSEVWRRVHWYIRAYISQGPVASIFTVINEVCKWYLSACVSDKLGACNGDPRRQLPRCHVPKQESRTVSSSLGDHVKNNGYREHMQRILILAVYFQIDKKSVGNIYS